MNKLNSSTNGRRLPSLSALRAFEATGRLGSAKRAATELSVTPTAVSHQIRQLEEALGIALFVRRPRQLLLNAEGRRLQAVLTESLDAIAAVVAELRSPSQRIRVTLSTTPAVAARLLLPWVCLLRESHSRLDLHIHASHEPVPLDGITADLAIRYGDGHWPGLYSEELFDNVFVPACSPALNLRHPADLTRHTLIHFEPPGGRTRPVDWSTWQQCARAPGLDVSAGMVFSDETHIIAAAVDGQGIALMSKALISRELRDGQLVAPFGPEFPGHPFHLAYPVERRDDPGIQAIRAWVIDLHGQQQSAEA